MSHEPPAACILPMVADVKLNGHGKCKWLIKVLLSKFNAVLRCWRGLSFHHVSFCCLTTTHRASVCRASAGRPAGVPAAAAALPSWSQHVPDWAHQNLLQGRRARPVGRHVGPCAEVGTPLLSMPCPAQRSFHDFGQLLPEIAGAWKELADILLLNKLDKNLGRGHWQLLKPQSLLCIRCRIWQVHAAGACCCILKHRAGLQVLSSTLSTA